MLKNEEKESAKNILVIDDDIMTLKSIEKQLKSQNYNLCMVSNPTLAVKMLFENDFDLILTDIKMSPIDGIDVLKKIKSYRPGVPVIILTGEPDEAIKNSAKELGCSDFLTKPVAKKQLIDAINNVKKIY
ncbi:MAG TPA: response regulator [Spirochaetota bacterium]|nr:response regulator [Spirochaetota bacterium]